MELTLLEQITNAVRARVHPFRVEAREVGNTVDGKPIILDEDGELMDGRHRLMKAMLLGKVTIKAVMPHPLAA